jgi:hypothetical protein
VLTKWGDGGKLGDQTTMAMTNEYAELSLEGIDMATRLDSDRLMVQCNKEGGNPFNFTAIVLVKKDVDTGIKELDNWTISPFDNSSDNDQVNSQIVKWYNLAGQCMVNPNKGMYIVNGKKVVVK